MGFVQLPGSWTLGAHVKPTLQLGRRPLLGALLAGALILCETGEQIWSYPHQQNAYLHPRKFTRSPNGMKMRGMMLGDSSPGHRLFSACPASRGTCSISLWAVFAQVGREHSLGSLRSPE